MQKMHLIYDYQLNQINECLIVCLASDDVPLLWSCDDDVGRRYLLLREMGVTRQLSHLDSIRLKSQLKVTHHFRDQCFHWSDVNYLKGAQVESRVCP